MYTTASPFHVYNYIVGDRRTDQQTRQLLKIFLVAGTPYLLKIVVALFFSTRVQVCSIVSTQEEFTLPYKAIGKYKVPGLTGAEVFEMLKSVPGTYREGDNEVHVPVFNTLEGSAAMNTEFIVTSADSPDSCMELRTRIDARKRAKICKRFGSCHNK